MTKRTRIPHLHPTIRQYTKNPEIAGKYDDFFKHNPLFTFDCQYLHEHLSPPGKILDLGCGTARHLLFLESLGFDTVGIDLSQEFLNISREKILSFGKQANNLIRADIMHLPLRNGVKFDGIILMFSVLGLIQGHENRSNLLKSLIPHLHTDSRLIIHVHNYQFRYSALVRKLKKIKNTLNLSELKESGDKIVHNYRGIQDIFIHSFTLDEITDLITDSGYNINDITGLNTRRDGICTSNIRKNANGFLISAYPAQM